MNAKRRKSLKEIFEQISELKNQLENLREEEEQYTENMPENLWGSERYEKSQEHINDMGEAKVKVELDPEYFTEEWLEDFRQYFYDFFTLKECAEHIVYNVVHNNATEIEGFGIPLRDGKRPYWIKDNQEVNEHINIIYNSYATDVEYE